METTETTPDSGHKIWILPDTVGLMGIRLEWATIVNLVLVKAQGTKMVPPEQIPWGDLNKIKIGKNDGMQG